MISRNLQQLLNSAQLMQRITSLNLLQLTSPTKPFRIPVQNALESEMALINSEFRTVSIVDKLQEIGRHPQTVCPFQVETKPVENNHPLGNVIVAINEIVCSGACKNENCSRTGGSCKQKMTTLQVSIRNPVTGLPEKVISTNVAAGCSCTP